MNVFMKLKQFLCIHNYKYSKSYEDKNNNCWVVVRKCEKCRKEFAKRDYYPPKCKISGKYCYERLDNCTLCDTYMLRSIYDWKDC